MIIWYTRWAVIHMNMVHKVGCFSDEYGAQGGLLFK